MDAPLVDFPESPVLDVVYEDDDMLVVDKPAGLVVHPSKTGEMSSVVGRTRLYLRHSEGRLVNRLDRETSGLVLIAKSAPVASELGRLLAAGGMSKRYAAIVHGQLAPGTERRILAPLGKDERSPVFIKDCVRDDGAAAETHIRCVSVVTRAEGSFSLLEVTPITGRKHQIRIHLAHIAHPIVGDKLYGVDELIYLRLVAGRITDDDRSRLLLEYHALHAGSLQFTWRGRAWSFEAPVPRRLTAFLGGRG